MKKLRSKLSKFKQLNKKEKLFFAFCIVVFLLIIIPIGISSSRFISTKLSEFYFNSKNFYFNSNILNGKTYDIASWDGRSPYTFEIDVHNSKALLNITEEDIAYTINITCPNTVTCTSTNSSSSLIYSAGNRTINNHTITIDPGANTFDDGTQIDVVIQAISSSPYEKTLSSTFRLIVNESKINYYIEDNENKEYLTLYIENNEMDKDITIDFDEELLTVDESNYFVQNASSTATVVVGGKTLIDAITMATQINNVYSIRFYKVDKTQNYSLNSDIINIS